MTTVAESILAEAARAIGGEGWACLRRALDRSSVDKLCADTSTLVRGLVADPRCLHFYETVSGDRRLVRVERLWEALPSLAGGELGRSVRRLAEACLAGPACLFKDKINLRWPGSAGYAPHQDTAAGWLEFAPTFLSVVVFLGRSDSRSGGFEVVTARHREGRFPNTRGEMAVALFETMSPRQVGGDAGDVLLLDGETPHRTLPNVRQACTTHLILTFNERSAGDHRSRYYAAKARDFGSGQIAPNQFVFRVFEFGGNSKPGGG